MNITAKTAKTTKAGRRGVVTMVGAEWRRVYLTCVLRLELEGGLLRKAG